MSGSDSHAFSGFLESEIGKPSPEKSQFHVIPVPLEQTVSYGGGTSKGPEAILRASQELEVYDLKSVPAEKGISTMAPVDCSGDMIKILGNISDAVGSAIDMKSVPVVLGGEHSLTEGAVRAFVERGFSLGVVQFDAHADLRDSYHENPRSHACVMRRIFDMDVPFFQIGVRNLCPEEVLFRDEKDINYIDAREIMDGERSRICLPADFPEWIYVTIDIDVLDCSLMPATGTPEPGGLFWYDLINILEYLSKNRKIAGFDLVELAPVKGLNAPDYTAAKIVYAFMGMITRSMD